MDIERAIQVMESAAKKAGDALVAMQATSVRLASRKDFLSDADLLSEEIILRELSTAFPSIPAFSEEKGGEKLIKGYQWVIDPVDGTINFFHQRTHWGVSIALVHNAYTVAGVVCLAGKKQLFSAVQGRMELRSVLGTSPSIAPELSKARTLSHSQFSVGWGKNDPSGYQHKRVLQLISRLDSESIYPLILNSTVADIMDICMGRSAGYVHLNPEPFDVAAAGYILQQLGGRVTDKNGHQWSPFSDSIVASNGLIHDEFLHLVNSP